MNRWVIKTKNKKCDISRYQIGQRVFIDRNNISLTGLNNCLNIGEISRNDIGVVVGYEKSTYSGEFMNYKVQFDIGIGLVCEELLEKKTMKNR